MHEYHEAIHIIQHAIDQAKDKGKNKVTRINLVIGDDSGYSGETIRLHFEDAAQGTICEGAEIAVREVKSMLKCPDCGEMFVRKPFHFECPHCGALGVPCEVGREMSIESIQTE